MRTPVSTLDLVPTLLEAVGASVPPGLDGRSLLGDRASRVTVEASDFAGRYQHRALIHGEDKWVVRLAVQTGKIVARWRTDLAADPGESRKLPWSVGDEGAAAWLLELVASDPDPAGIPGAYRQGRRLDGPKIRPGVSAAQLEKLRAMGYAK